MIYNSWDIECDRLKFVIMSHFLPFYHTPPHPTLLKTKKIIILKKKKNIVGDIIILHMCTKNHNHMRYSSWDTDKHNFLLCWVIFHPYPPSNPKNQNLERIKKASGNVIFYTRVPKITIIWCTCFLRQGVRQI